MESLLKAGIGGARFNLAHMTHKDHTENIIRLRRLAKSLGVRVATMMDSRHGTIRTGPVTDGRVELKAGYPLRIICNELTCGNETTLSCLAPTLPEHVDVGDTILVADGSISLQ